MARNRTLQRIRRRLVYWGARAVQGLAFILPFDLAISLGGWLGKLAFVVLRGERNKTIKHLRTAFGQEKQEDELRGIAQRVFVNAGRCAAEILLYPRWSDERMRRRIEFDEPDALRKAVSADQGVVTLSAHFGNWELMGVYTARILGWNSGVIARRLSNPHIDRLINDYRRRLGLKVFMRGERAAGFYKHLIRGGALGILGDQDVRGIEGVFVDFFGQPAHTPTGPAELIVRTGVPCFVCVLERQADGRSHRLVFEGPLPIPEGEDRASRVRQLTQDYMHRVERIIRRNPDQWMWMHNRWKKKPAEEK